MKELTAENTIPISGSKIGPHDRNLVIFSYFLKA